MKKQRKRALWIIAGLLIVLFFIIVVARPLQTEFHFDPEWVINLTTDTPDSTAAVESRLYFKLGNSMGYFTPDGRLSRLITVPYKGVISSAFSAVFPANAENTPFTTPDGTIRGRLQGSGFPWFDEDRIFLFHPGGTAFSRCFPDGTLAWSWEGFSPILAIASSPGGTVAGFADGSIVHLDAEGSKTTKITPGGSTYPVILGVDISSDGNLIASISGLQRQRFVRTELTGNTNRGLYHEYFDADSNQPGVAYFTTDDTHVYFAQPGRLTALDLQSLDATPLPLQGTVISVIESPVANLTFVLSRAGSTYWVYSIEDHNLLLGSFSFEATHACIRTHGSALYVGRDSTISKINISRK
jgi:hypothetical protein